MIPYAKLYASDLSSLCVDGESVLDAISIQYAEGLELCGSESNRITVDILDGVDFPAVNRATHRLIAGLTLDVRDGWQARSLAEAARANPFLVLTNRRLLIIEKLQHDDRAITWSTPLKDVSFLRCNPRLPIDLGRLHVGFGDGSSVRLRAGLWIPIAALRFSTAFTRATGR